MAPLSPDDVKRWDADAIHGVFQVATNRAATLQTLGDSLQQVHGTLSDWHGEAGDAFRADLGKARRDIEADGHESKQVAAAVSRAEADVRAVKAELDRIEQAADGYGFTVMPDWRIDAGGIKLDGAKAVFKEQLQGLLDGCKLHAHSADQELATAVRSAVGEAAVGADAPQSPVGNQPKSLQDMLLPTGPGSGDAAKGPPVPGDAGSGKPPSMEDMLLGRGQPADQRPPPGSPLDLLSRIKPGATGIPAPPLKPAEIESFKALARRTMISDGVPPDQIEARLNAVVTNTQQWLDAGAPRYIAPEGPRPPAPGVGEGFGDRWFSTEEGIKALTGQNGLGAMGDAWGGMAQGLGHKAEEYLTMGPVAPIKDAVGEFKSFLDNPAYYAGGKAADVAFTAPTLMFGPEGVGLRAGLGEGLGEMSGLDAVSGVTHGAPGIHPPISPLEDALPGFHPPEVPPEGPSPGGIHPSSPIEGPPPAGHALHAPSEPPAGGVHAPGGAPESAAPVSHLPPPAAPGGIHPSGPVDGSAPNSHASSPAEHPVSGGHSSSGPIDQLPAGVVEHGPAPESQWAPLGHDHPITYHPEASQAALELADAAAHGQPTAEFSQRVADMSTHYVGDNPDRVVLGKWAGDESGYIGEARGRGGIYYDTSSEVWNNIGHGLSEQAANDLGWEVNENFLRTQMERGVDRIDYVTEGTRFNSIADVIRLDPDSFSAKEIRYLVENAGNYGYERVGDSWIRVGGGQQ
ncbi:MAG: hypothetical protein QOG47_1866 [Mycobacterium sp.]|nr:hypothetical protein [Mycobacterium sp.]